MQTPAIIHFHSIERLVLTNLFQLVTEIRPDETRSNRGSRGSISELEINFKTLGTLFEERLKSRRCRLGSRLLLFSVTTTMLLENFLGVLFSFPFFLSLCIRFLVFGILSVVNATKVQVKNQKRTKKISTRIHSIMSI